MSIIFRTPTRHGRHTFVPGTPLGFEDPDAEPYFIAAGFADDSTEEPKYVYPLDAVDIDPQTTFADGPNKGQLVMDTDDHE